MEINNSVQKTDSLPYEKQNNDQITREILPETKLDNKKPPVSKEELEMATEKLNKTVRIFNKRFHFSVHEKTHRVVVEVIDTATDKIINEIPPEKVLDMVASMDKMLGLIVDEKL